jgi:hypothetical protein
MGWWKVQGTDATIGDGPLDALGGAVRSVVEAYQAAFNRTPTPAEWEALLTVVLGADEPDPQVRRPMSRAKEQCFAIVRVDEWAVGQAKVENDITVKMIVWDQLEAEREVARLNQLNGPKGCHYFWRTSRAARRRVSVSVEAGPAGASTGPSRPDGGPDPES